MVVGVTDGFPRSSRSSASATAPRPRAPTTLRLALGFSHPVIVKAPDGHHLRGAGADADHRQRHRQGGRRPGRRQHPLASASPSRTRARACATSARRSCARPARPGRSETIMSKIAQTAPRRPHHAATAGSARRSTAPRRVRAWPCSVPTSTSSLQVIDDDAGRTLAAASTAEADQRAAGSGAHRRRRDPGRQARRRAGQGRRHRAGRVRPRRVPLPRACRGGRRCRPRSRSGVLMPVLQLQQPASTSASRSERPARVAGHHHQPRRQGRQGRPSLLVHRARRDRRRQRPRRPRLRQGQGSAAGDPEGHRRGQEEPVRRRRSPAAPSPTRSSASPAPVAC